MEISILNCPQVSSDRHRPVGRHHHRADLPADKEVSLAIEIGVATQCFSGIVPRVVNSFARTVVDTKLAGQELQGAQPAGW